MSIMLILDPFLYVLTPLRRQIYQLLRIFTLFESKRYPCTDKFLWSNISYQTVLWNNSGRSLSKYEPNKQAIKQKVFSHSDMPNSITHLYSFRQCTLLQRRAQTFFIWKVLIYSLKCLVTGIGSWIWISILTS